MKPRLLRALARHPLFAAATVLGLAVFSVASGVRAVCQPDAVDLEDDSGRAILNRFWMDQWPDSPTSKAHYLLFMPGGMGLHEEGAAYKFSVEFFEFERFGKRLETKFLDDGEKKEVKFKVERCDELPPFDACSAHRGTVPRTEDVLQLRARRRAHEALAVAPGRARARQGARRAPLIRRGSEIGLARPLQLGYQVSR